ncbi:hypothetical protein BH09BAC1_BH09BAC1_19730 [soil metagenome]
MGNHKYLLLLALAATTAFASCSKDGKDDDDSRTAIVGSYDVTATLNEVNGSHDTTVISGVTYLLTITLPTAGDSLSNDFIIIRNIANDEVNGDIPASLTNDVLVFDPQGIGRREVAGTATVNGNTITGSFTYLNRFDMITSTTFTATKRN